MALTWLAVASLLTVPASAESASSRAGLAATAARLDALHRRVSGNRAERRASELLSYHQIEGGVAACMRAAGKTYRVAPFVSRYDLFTDADLGYGTGSGSVFDSITGRGRSVILNELAGARFARAGLLTWWDSLPAADVPAHNRCTARFQHRTYPDYEPPAGVNRFSGFADLFAPVVRDPAVIAALRPYRGCMKQRYGYDVDERTDFLFRPRISYRDAPLDGRPPTAAWTRGVREVRAAFAADVDCRLPAYRIAMRLLAPRLGPWERWHREELDSIHRAWRQRVIQARDLPQPVGATVHIGR
ncbi:hypothetical protein [Actinoplanes sp. NPDC049599]|uniref:hypothetical protein n=1 Tax=Actinoplanes sp. NPDC049599 TaxID=3363903 RepID=UPI0037B87186